MMGLKPASVGLLTLTKMNVSALGFGINWIRTLVSMATDPLPTYVIPLNRYSRTTHPLAFRQLYARTDYY